MQTHVASNVTKHYSWVPVSFLTFIYNRDLIAQVVNGDLSESGLLGVLRAFYSCNWNTVKKFADTTHPIPKPEVMVKHITALCRGEASDLFYGAIYDKLKSLSNSAMDVTERRDTVEKMLADQSTGKVDKVSSFDALGGYKDQQVVRAAIEVIDEMFRRDGTYPRPPKQHTPRSKHRTYKTARNVA